MVHSKEAKDEIRSYFKKRTAFVDVGGDLMISANIPPVELVVANMTGDPID